MGKVGGIASGEPQFGAAFFFFFESGGGKGGGVEKVSGSGLFF